MGKRQILISVNLLVLSLVFMELLKLWYGKYIDINATQTLPLTFLIPLIPIAMSLVICIFGKDKD